MRNKKGFTLAELLIVVAIIAVLVAIAIPIFVNQLEKGREATDIANIRDIYAEVAVAMLTDDLGATDGSTATVGNGLTATAATATGKITITVASFPLAQKIADWQTDAPSCAGKSIDKTLTIATTKNIVYTFKVDGNSTYLESIALS